MSGFTRAPRLPFAGALLFSLHSGRSRALRLGMVLLAWLICQTSLTQGRHVVQRGDTLYALAARYGTTVEELRLENGLSGTVLRVGQLLELPGRRGFRFESALAGETLGQLAARLELGVSTLEMANPGLTGALAAGTRVRVPPGEGRSLRLEESDSALGLAMRHGVAPSELLEANDLEHLGELEAGDWLFLPVPIGSAPEAAVLPSQDGLAVAPPSAARPPNVLPGEATAPGIAGRALPSSGSEGALVHAVGGATGSHEAVVAAVTTASDWHARRQQELLLRTPTLIAEYAPTSSAFVMPLEGRLSSSYGWRNISVAGNRFHGGIDIAVDSGTPVAAALDGVVVRAGWIGAYGYAIYLDHGDGLQTRYAHLSEMLVGVGEWVRQGDTIARAGSTGASTGPHLHFEIRVAGQAVDPLTLLGR